MRPPALRVSQLQAAVARGVSRLALAALQQGLRCAGQQTSPRAPLIVERAASPVAPERIARLQPVDCTARDEARALYERCLHRYRTVQRPHDTVDDAGAAVACFVAASLQALHGVAPTSGMLVHLEQQLDGVARLNCGWQTASLAERQFFFERIAILAVLVADSWRQARSQGPAALANVRRAARSYLQELLGIDPDRLMLDAAGLSLRPPRGAARRAA